MTPTAKAPHPQIARRDATAALRENWRDKATRYLNMEHLKERKKEALRAIAA